MLQGRRKRYRLAQRPYHDDSARTATVEHRRKAPAADGQGEGKRGRDRDRDMDGDMEGEGAAGVQLGQVKGEREDT